MSRRVTILQNLSSESRDNRIRYTFRPPRATRLSRWANLSSRGNFDSHAFLQAIRAAKGRLRATHPQGMERFSRLSNVSAALLHIAMRNMGTESSELSGASYELLAAVVGSFDLDASPIMTTKGGFIIPFLLV